MGDSSPELKKMKQISDMKAFDDVFPELVQLMTKDGLKDSEVADAMTWYKEVGILFYFILLVVIFTTVVGGHGLPVSTVMCCKLQSSNVLFPGC